MKSYKQLFSRFRQSHPNRLHFAAHSHHYWPDCTFAAHGQAWLDAAAHADGKWGPIFSEIIPEAQRHVAGILGLPDSESVVFAPNTHEFVVRLFSNLEPTADGPPRILCSDGEFHSFDRQRRRWQEAGVIDAEVIAVDPMESFGERFLRAARDGEHAMVFVSHVFFNSGYVTGFLDELAAILRDRSTILVVDGYHAFMARPVDLGAIADKAFYIAGGYKYAMSGEGACFMHCPPGVLPRPVNTGWFAGFAGLEKSDGQVGYAEDGMRFAGATFDASGLYRLNAVQRMLADEGLDVATIHERVQTLQEQLVDGLRAQDTVLGELVPGAEVRQRGHFLTFASAAAGALCEKLASRDVVVDVRGDRLRFGFAIYHDPEDVQELLARLRGIE